MSFPTPATAPVLRVRIAHGRLAAEGTLAASFGCKVPGPAGGEPDGAFAGWRFDEAGGLTVENDRLGLYPFYRADMPDGIMLSTSVAALLAAGAPRELDYTALAVLVRLSTLVGDDTPFVKIRRMPPGANIAWTDEALVTSGVPPRVAAHGLGFDDTLDGFLAAFRDAVRRRLALCDRPLLPLSGGRDSRMIALAVAEAGVRPARCPTLEPPPPRYQEDVTIAAALASRLGFPHEIHGRMRDHAGTLLRALPRCDYASSEHAWMVGLADVLQGDPGQVLDGLAGDALPGYTRQAPELDALLRDDPSAYFDRACRVAPGPRIREEAVMRVLHPAVRRAMRYEVALERFLREARLHQDAPNPGGALALANRIRRSVAGIPFGNMAGHAVLTPYTDRSVHAIVAGADVRHLADGMFREKAMARAWPAHADLPFESKQGARSRFDRGFERRMGRALAVRLAAGPAPLVGRGFVLRHALQHAAAGDVRTAGWWSPPAVLHLLELGRIAAG